MSLRGRRFRPLSFEEALVARVAEVAGVSLPGAAHATLSTRTRGPYCVRPWSCCWKNIPVLSKPPVRDTPPTSTTPEPTLSLKCFFPERLNANVRRGGGWWVRRPSGSLIKQGCFSQQQLQGRTE